MLFRSMDSGHGRLRSTAPSQACAADLQQAFELLSALRFTVGAEHQGASGRHACRQGVQLRRLTPCRHQLGGWRGSGLAASWWNQSAQGRGAQGEPGDCCRWTRPIRVQGAWQRQAACSTCLALLSISLRHEDMILSATYWAPRRISALERYSRSEKATIGRHCRESVVSKS